MTTEQEFFEAFGIKKVQYMHEAHYKTSGLAVYEAYPLITPEIVLGLMLIHTKLTGGYIVTANCKTVEDIRNEVLNTLRNDREHYGYWRDFNNTSEQITYFKNKAKQALGGDK